MTSKQWLLITLVLIPNIVIFGAMLGDVSASRSSTPTPTWTPHPTFTPMPFPTATAILMPTRSSPVTPVEDIPAPTPIVHVVSEGETIETLSSEYGVSVFVLKMINRIPESRDVRAGQELIIPPPEE
jgi:LysM repeat protein